MWQGFLLRFTRQVPFGLINCGIGDTAPYPRWEWCLSRRARWSKSVQGILGKGHPDRRASHLFCAKGMDTIKIVPQYRPAPFTLNRKILNISIGANLDHKILSQALSKESYIKVLWWNLPIPHPSHLVSIPQVSSPSLVITLLFLAIILFKSLIKIQRDVSLTRLPFKCACGVFKWSH